MNTIIEEVLTKDGLGVHIIPNKKHKTINFVAKLRAPLSRDTITKRALLPYILRKGTKNYPSEKDLQLKLDSLYGAVLSIDAAKKGNNHIISFRLEIANEKYIEDESSIVDEAIALLNEVIFHPMVEGNSFNSNIFNREKETLQQKMNAVIDDKMAYANMRLIDEMCIDEAYQLHVHGYEEDLSTITAEIAYDYYQSVIKENQLDIYVLGDFDELVMKEKITATIKRADNKTTTNGQTETGEKRNQLKIVIDKQNVQQAKLHLGYRTHCTFQDEGYFALQVFNGIFGGFPSSKLFVNVREKNSLAYYAASRIESHKGLLLVFSGIDSNDYDKAREIIELQMTAMKNGDFTDEQLEETKELIVSQLLETLDHTQGIVELLYQQVLGDKKISPDELIANIKQVKKEDVVRVANKIEEDTVYLLKSKGGETNA